MHHVQYFCFRIRSNFSLHVHASVWTMANQSEIDVTVPQLVDTSGLDSDDEEPPALVEATEDAPVEHLRPTTDEEFKTLPKIPVTIVTGFLGAGKTTLMNFILTANHNKKIAVILNEFGEGSAMERSMSIGQDGARFEEWLELRNGCMCCSVKDNGVKAIELLMEKRGNFDYILLETTGLADPAPIASMFWLDEALCSQIQLDGIVTVVDSKNCLKQIQEQRPDGVLNEAIRQIASADRVIINKTDLIDADQLNLLRNTVLSMNAGVPIVETVKSVVDINFVLNLNAFDLSQARIEALVANDTHTSHIDTSVTTVTFERAGDVDEASVSAWLDDVLWEHDLPDTKTKREILRMKGMLSIKGNPKRAIVQAVYEMYDLGFTTEWEKDEPRINRLVFIGRNLQADKLIASFQKLVGYICPRAT
eukprot:m.149376 g.149376  ORF g.149376 m.149376 type:complete len:421 (-) comp30653_c0_seq4:339-1601(-)